MDTTRMHQILGTCEVSWREGFRLLIEQCFPDRLASGV
jgi:hypothetical protein